ncbi:angiopoietin-related protein 2-like isoform X3 [Physella acuta]|uniref:angiopoietin-related protein 2-like isoform X3 n=1 Tax=Physella acuta TaxID=109671 RepID=UPI0027DAFAE3|nr:angiopoietin-related protein 2-like isoform X3 [Physella acuta]
MMRFLTYICVIVVACIPIKCLEFQMDRTSPRVPGAFCARLSCQENLASDSVTYSLVNMSIYRESRDRMLLASLTEVDGQLRHQGHTGVKVNGSIGKTSADMEVLMSVTSYCQDTAFVCQVMFADDKGQIGVREKVVPLSTIPITPEKSRFLTLALKRNDRQRRSTQLIDIDTSALMNDSESATDLKKRFLKILEAQQTLVQNLTHKLETRVLDVENMFQILHQQLGISKNESHNQTGSFIYWPFSYAEFISQPKRIKCERNMDPSYPKMTLVVLENGRIVMCDTETDGGGWIVMQRRVIGDVNFQRNWYDYKHGFGSYNGDFWLGNELVSNLTSQGLFDLRIEIGFSNNEYIIQYDSFKVEDESSWYKLRLGQHTAGSYNDLAYQKDMEFYTYDRDSPGQYVKAFTGGWWFCNCGHYSNPNGLWNTHTDQGIKLASLTSTNSVSRIELKFRRRAN